MTTWVEEEPVKEMRMKGDRTSSGKSSCNFYYLMPFVLYDQFLIPGTCECYFICKRDFSDAVKNLEIEKLLCIIQVGPKYNYKCPYKREI